MKNMNIGAHIPSKNAIDEISYRKGETFQIFISSPQMWKSPKPREDIEILQDFKGNIYVHAPYLINVATPNNKVRHPSRKLLKDTCKEAATFGAKGVIVHGGSVGDINKINVYANETIEERIVELGGNDDFWVAVLSGVEVGEKIVIESALTGTEEFEIDWED